MALALPTVDETRRELLHAWKEWDAACVGLADAGHTWHGAHGRLESQAAALELAFGNHAQHFGLRTTPFRDVCAALRRATRSREQALAAAEAAFTAIGLR